MTDALSQLSTLAVELFAVTSMLAVGLRYSVGEIFAPLRNVGGTIAVLLANFVAIPLLAFLVSRVIQLDAVYADGLMIVACAAGAAFIIKLLAMAKNDVAFGSGMLVLLVVVTIAYMPLVLPRLVPAGEVSAGAVARPLVITMLAPLAAGMIVRPLVKGIIPRVLPLLARITNISLIALVVLSLGLNLTTVRGVFGTGAIIAAILFTIGAYGVGWLVSAYGHALRDDVGLITAQRNFAAALVVAAESFTDRRVLVMVVVTSLLSFVVLIPGAKWLGKRQRAASPSHPYTITDHGQKPAA